LLADPTETNIFVPSGENTTSRVQWFEPLGSRATTVSAGPRLEVAIGIREAHDRIRVRHVDPLRVRARRIEGNAERLVQARGEHLLARLAILGRAQHPDAAGAALDHEYVAVGRNAHLARSFEPGGEQAHLESRRHHRLFGAGARGHPHKAGARRCLVRGRQIGCSDVTTQAGPIGPPVGEGRFSLEKPGAVLRRRRPGECRAEHHGCAQTHQTGSILHG
jgi:hypothetical protein